jgi:hypothetical protein
VPNSAYEISVCAATSKGKGPRSTIVALTCDLGDVVPGKPTFCAIGRREVIVRWSPPKALAGKLNRYDLLINSKCVYSGVNVDYRVIQLRPDTDYVFQVCSTHLQGQRKNLDLFEIEGRGHNQRSQVFE